MSLFRENQRLSDPAEIKAKIEEGENRLSIAVHYGIPYPRLHHVKPKIYKPAPAVGDTQPAPAAVRNEKLKAAMERMRQKENA